MFFRKLLTIYTSRKNLDHGWLLLFIEMLIKSFRKSKPRNTPLLFVNIKLLVYCFQAFVGSPEMSMNFPDRLL